MIPASAPPKPPPWVTPEAIRVGRFVLGSRLGKGGMGEVFEAWDTLLRREVALKRFHNPSPMAVARFLREARLQSRLDHPNVCRILEVDTSAGGPVIAMQLVRGQNLEEIGPSLDESAKVGLMAKVAEAVHAAHRVNLIHRDLKPANILVQHDPEGGWVPFVCDFGLAMDLDEEALTQTQARMGTPAFMAPEQLRGDRNQVGPATDIYALGATLHFLLLGRPPMDPPISVGSENKNRQALRNQAGALPKDLETILFKCLEADPRDRYDSAAALAEDLHRALLEVPIMARRAGFLELTWRAARHQKVLATVSVSGALMILALGAWNLRATARNRAQLRAAQAFALDLKDLEQLLRLERMLPAHDLRPAFVQVRHRMEALRTKIRALGSQAEGPGHYALGRGHMALREPEQALQELEAAWKGGYQTPDVAYALGRVHWEMYWLKAEGAAFSGDAVGVQTAQSNHLPQARDYFAKAGGQSFDSPALAEALTARIAGDLPRALAKAREAFAEHPWDVEAKANEAYFLIRMGYDRMVRGDDQGAGPLFEQAEAAAQQATTLGRSDESAHQAAINLRNLAAIRAFERGRPDKTFLEALETRCDTLIALNPDYLVGQATKLQAIWFQAMERMEKGEDPTAHLDRGLRYFQQEVAPRGSHVNTKVDRMVLHLLKARWAWMRGQDPTPELDEALREPGHSPYRLYDYWGEALNLRAEAMVFKGQSPLAIIEANLARSARMLDRPDAYPFHMVRARAWMIRAGWEDAHGPSAGTSWDQAQAAITKTLELNPAVAQVHALQARIGAGQAEWLERSGKNEAAEISLSAALRGAEQAIRLRPDWFVSHAASAEAWRAAAKIHRGEQARKDTVLAEREANLAAHFNPWAAPK